MAKIFKANIINWLKTKLNSSNSNIKINGTQSAGTSDLIARADHVHPTDTSRAPNNHASSATTYGVSSASNYGHAMASSTSPRALGTASVGSETTKFARGDHVHPTPAAATTSANGLMSSADKSKLDGIATGATKVTVDSALSSSSTNPLQNKAINTALNAKSNSNHTHGNISNDGKIGSTANLPVITGTGGVLQASSFGTGANTFCQGNDSRLSNARTPVFNNINPSSSATKNLNDYKTGGFYYVGNDNVAGYVSNQPLTSGQKSFFLLVETWGATSTYVKQTLTYYNTNITYTRTCSNNTWSGWTALIKEGDSRLTNARTPTSHSHGSLANGGTLNSDITSVNKVAVTDSSNNLKTISKVPFANLNISKANITGLGIPASDTTYSAGTGLTLSSNKFSVSYGTASGTACQGNDSRLSNARTPTAHTDSNGAYGKATISVWGHTKLNSATNSTDETTSATPKAVKSAYDLANSKVTSVDKTGSQGVLVGSGTIYIRIKNGWCMLRWENISLPATVNSWITLANNIPSTQDMVYSNFKLDAPYRVRVNGSNLQFYQNGSGSQGGIYGHIMYPTTATSV